MTAVYLSIGSNIDPRHNVTSALAALRREFGAIRVSPVYACPAQGFAGADFYNLAVGLQTDLDVDALQQCIHAIESAHGRVRGQKKFSARTLDIDLLLYGDLVVERSDLSLPRDEILNYAFVLGPLAQLAPDLRDPLLGVSMAELWRQFSGPRALNEVHLEAVDDPEP